jgi:hypothetical protein
MKYFLTVWTVIVLFNVSLRAQKVYTTSGGEIIFQSAIIESNGENLNTNIRFTLAFHLGELVHFDFGENIGIFSGIGVRNVGFITNEEDIKIKFRSYNLGIPLALKIGSFKKNLYVFGGAEYEWMFHFKQKTFRDGTKYKKSAWFSEQTPAFIPSVFAGIQFPEGFQLKFKYYLNDFLNHKYNGGPYENYTLLNKSQIWYISVSYMIRNKSKENREAKPVDMASL